MESISNFLPTVVYVELKDWLDQLELYPGKTSNDRDIDRMQKWFHIDGEYFNSRWVQDFDRWQGHYFPVILQKVLDHVNETLSIDMNSCLVNFYKDGSCFIPKHIDSVNSFGKSPTIVNLSIGATRVLRVKDQDYSLVDNSIFIMSGPSKVHELLKDDQCTEPRWSLTFRKKL